MEYLESLLQKQSQITTALEKTADAQVSPLQPRFQILATCALYAASPALNAALVNIG
jgi:hypothetical protein